MSRPHASLSPEVLLVDDDALTLRGIARYVASLRPAWHVRTATSAQDALGRLALHPADVVLTDVDMGAGPDGVSLLAEVAQRWPKTVRLLYCGGMDPDRALAAADVAHQILTKGGDPAPVVDAIEQVLRASAPVQDLTLWEVVAGSNQLPPGPTVFPALEAAAQDPRSTAQDLTRILARDPAVSARVMQLASSAFVGLPPHVRTLEGAVGWLGLRTIRGLVLSVEVLRSFEGRLPHPLSATRLANHAFRTADLAARIARDWVPAQLEVAYMAAVVHDLGVLVLGSRVPDRYREVLRAAAAESLPRHHVEQRLLGIDHAGVGAAVLELWGLDASLVAAVRQHHTVPQARDAAAVVFLANHLCREAEEEPVDPLPGARLARLGVSAEQLERWRGRAADGLAPA